MNEGPQIQSKVPSASAASPEAHERELVLLGDYHPVAEILHEVRSSPDVANGLYLGNPADGGGGRKIGSVSSELEVAHALPVLSRIIFLPRAYLPTSRKFRQRMTGWSGLIGAQECLSSTRGQRGVSGARQYFHELAVMMVPLN
jgi:hypothetical protein